ncbi:dihydroneopterin aldolase [Homoserinimonas aerilata]|uniref:7,8-dihydroneopterin aldolase n=1 Tax=Homoserinimonas aerilata TaxID=1162970 RepID=A0A542Y1N0_9MICO|nr:dihydroneopterin aldolase [Homoserinimonas aerilata]TQL41984.1 dihydroneopterin aldolase [Homoserinimonas aerilata]
MTADVRIGSGDHITLTGLRARGHHGVFAEERRDGQEFVIDVTVWLDLGVSGASDELAQTVHYGELANAAVAAVETEPVDLIETVAQRVADVALSFAAVQATRVTLHKPSAPIEVPFDDVSVTITRLRQ